MWLKFKRNRLPERVKHRQGLLRLLAYGACVGVVCAGVSIRAARAEVEDQTVVVGRQMLQMANTEKNEVHKVVLNGQPVFFSQALTNDDVPTVLGRFDRHCVQDAAQSPEEWRQVAEAAAKVNAAEAKEKGALAQSGGIIRGGNNDEGTIVCFVKSSKSKATIGEALQGLYETGELGAFGQLRYVYAKKTKSGRTHLLTAWTLDKFNIKEIVPPEGTDVPGEEFADIPRPDGATRTFSVRLEGTPYGANVYESKGDPEKIALAYDEMMIKKGWLALDLESDAKRNDPHLKNAVARIYEKDGAMFTVVNDRDGDVTTTGIGLAGNRGHEVAREDREP